MMTDYENVLDSDAQISFQNNQTAKNSSGDKLFDSGTSEISGTWMNSNATYSNETLSDKTLSSQAFFCFNQKWPVRKNVSAMLTKFRQIIKSEGEAFVFHLARWDKLCVRQMGISAAAKKPRPEILGWRRAVREDKKAIRQLQSFTGDVANLLYREKCLDELIEKCYFPVVQFDTNGEVISFTAYESFPNLPVAPFWIDWLNINYKIDGVNPGNVFFVHYMVWQPEHKDKFLSLLLETSFTEFVFLTHIILIQPPQTDIPGIYAEYFVPVFPIGVEELEKNSIQLLHICLRSSVIHPPCIRTALEQELDIIISIINSDPRKKKRKDPSNFWDLFDFVCHNDRKTLICEVQGQLAGVMVLNLKIDLNLLNEGFELEPFNGLRKKDTRNEETTESEVSLTSEKASHLQSYNVLRSSKFMLSSMNWDLSFSNLHEAQDCSMKNVTSASTSDTNFSQFSYYDFSPLYDLKSNSDVTQVSSHKKSEPTPKVAGEVNLMIRTSESTMTHFFPPMYHGQSNAFIIDFFAIDCNRVHEKASSLDFLEAVFKVVPDREYCIVLTPTNYLLPCSLLDLFVRVTPRPLSSLKQELYLCHKDSLLVASMSVRGAGEDDLTNINNFLKNVDEGVLIHRDILNSFEKNENLKCFVFTLEDTIIGVSLLMFENCTEQLSTYFEIPDFTYKYKSENESVIKHLVISPKYNNHARFFLRDLIRLVDANGLYYVNHKSLQNHSNLVTILGELTPMKPKKQAGTNDPLIFSGKDIHKHLCSLYVFHPQLFWYRKMHLNVVIVIVGASRTALSFLETLVFGSESCLFNFNNVICVSPRGLEVEEVEEQVHNLMFPDRDCFSRNYSARLSLSSYVSSVHGVMTQINRSEKYIVVNNKSPIKYDYLILTCGLQYLAPIPKSLTVAKLRCPKQKNYKSSLSRFLHHTNEKQDSNVQKHLHNMFIINTRREAHVALQNVQFLLQNIKLEGKKIIVYGHDLHVFLTINSLLKLGIPGEFIVFVEPFPTGTKSVTLFNDYCVDQTVLESVKECKVNYYTDYCLHDWSVSAEDYITSIKFHSKRKQLVIPCLAFFPFIEKLVPNVTFNACNDAGLVYDGRLVVNHNFRTNDKYIYAAGSFTKYARRYYATECNHQYYNSREVGQKLAEIIRGKIDPTIEEETKETSELVLQLVAPVFYHCHLPGDLNLFKLRKPGKELDLETAYNLEHFGEVLTTGDKTLKQGSGYFRLHLSPEGFVESITCLTKNKIDYENLISLYGLHERILNNLLLRYDLAMIPDLFEYFRQPWALAIFHNSFQCLRDHNNEVFFQKMSDDKTFCDRVVEELENNNWALLDEPVKQQLETEYMYSKMHYDIKNNLLQFLEYYKEELAMYGLPSKLRLLKKKPRKV